MKLVIQRVTEGSVSINNKITGKIGRGFVVLLGIEAEDTDDILSKFVSSKLYRML